ncbi:HAD-IIA family hydrolase [Salicibibacter cibi]|uniref:HAD-IIA family hydrolase n=1 Tax=Salicibibacter cibi TaxID=2743001 RepID=A0A7T6ZCY2_9BACI|nr:HAD-IIA family hydrolase [Salicibibacter cibi]QQK81082.1 HAD-IIA family hydrolase [Salicibibacter cibi]
MKRGYVFDLDGTIYLGKKAIEGAANTLHVLRQRGDKVIFLSNNPLYSRYGLLKKLEAFGVDAKLDEIFNSNYILSRYLKKKLKVNDTVWVLGEWPLFQELQNHNISITHNPIDADYIAISWDRDFTYEKLHQAFRAWESGAKLIATNPDRTCPTDTGPLPDTGAIIGAIEGATGESIKNISGKPSSIAVDVIQEVLELPPISCYMVGDRLETDIAMANSHRWNSVLVLTGVTSEESAYSHTIKPNYVLNSIKDLLNI